MGYITDEEVTLNKDTDILGVNVYAETLIEIVNSNLNNEKPLIIGVFGGPGTGKSTIAKTAQSRLKRNRKVRVMLYDAWKYSTEAFRGSFITELRETFRLPEHKQEDTKSVSETKAVQEKRFRRVIITVVLVLFLIGIILVSFLPKLAKMHTAFNIFSNTGLIFLIIFILERSFSERRTAFKTFSTEEFENIFNNTVNRIISRKRGIKKLVVIIDNVDRCPKELTKELLLTVKSFLRNKKCIFILPLDNETIKKHIEYEGKEATRYVRRFFDTTIKLKRLMPQNLYEFTRDLIRRYKFHFSDEIADLFSQEFSDSPRKIIQYLNNLYTEKMIAKKQEYYGNIKKGAITDNLEFLAKLLVIREEWPLLYDEIASKPFLLTNINDAIKKDTVEFDNEAKIYDVKISHANYDNVLTLTTLQFWFLKRTLAITAPNIEDFLRIEDLEKDLPPRLKQSMYKQDWQSIKHMIETDDLTIDKFFGVLFQELDLALIKRKLWKTDGFHLLNLLFTAIYDNQYEKYFYKVVNFYEPFVHNENIKKIINAFAPEPVVFYSKKLHDAGKNYLQRYIVEVINEDRVNNAELLQMYSKYFNAEVL
jgi:adenylate kinase